MGSVPELNKRSAAVRGVPTVLCSVAIVYLGTRRNLSFPGDEILLHDKLLHAFAFGVLSTITYRLLCLVWTRIGRGYAGLVAATYTTALGAALELIQATLPYRSMEFADLVADAIGAVFCAVVAIRARIERDWTRWRI